MGASVTVVGVPVVLIVVGASVTVVGASVAIVGAAVIVAEAFGVGAGTAVGNGVAATDTIQNTTQ